MKASIDLQIGELELRGISPDHKRQVAEATQAELASLLGAGDLMKFPAAGQFIPDLVLEVPAEGVRPANLGIQIARQLYQALTGQVRTRSH